MSMWVWLIMLACIGLFALIFIPLYMVTEEGIIPAIRSSMTNETNVQNLDYMRTVWIFLPFIFLIGMIFWAINQAQKEQ